MNNADRFPTKKSLGQHFLNSDVVPRWMCEAGAVQPGDIVLEIGPGTGALSRELLARGAVVKAIEADERAIERLRNDFASALASGQLQVERGDLRKLSAAEVAERFGLGDHQYKLIANIPYYLSGRLFRSFLETTVQPSTLVFLVQKEVAERICRDPKESLLSLSVKVFGVPTYVRTVSRGHFTPPPQIDSAILAITNIDRSNFKDLDPERFFTLLQLGFGQRRKQLAGNLATQYPRNSVLNSLSTAELSPTIRAEDVDLKKWLEIARYLLSTTS